MGTLTSTPSVPAVAAGLRRLMRDIAQPVVVVTGCDTAGRLHGMTVSTFTSVSLDPPLVLFCPAHASATWRAIAPVRAFAINVLTEDQAVLAARFAAVGDRSSPSAAWLWLGHVPVLAEATVTARCSITAVYPGGDHHVVVAAVDEVRGAAAGGPLSFWLGDYASAHPLQESPCPR